MSTVMQQTLQCPCTYTLLTTEECVEEQKVIEYGIRQIYEDENQEKIETVILCISDDKRLVEDLLIRLKGEDVSPVTLQYIVEDYINEVFGL